MADIKVRVWEESGNSWVGLLLGWVSLAETYRSRAGIEIRSIPYAMVADMTGPIFKVRYDRLEMEV